ncbi:hypothetical protein ALO73_200119 [Pseudomonas syringae pv. daphniphylli]|uniref:Mechanosensitive ion channel protein MscS n=2 Tax=Pseudomonas syringae TaxID=317 RepID=A0A9X0H6I1_PSESX|nr:hypothetical protein ALO73_200119 [Pseudomonas syringae pv. daphniphylli]
MHERAGQLKGRDALVAKTMDIDVFIVAHGRSHVLVPGTVGLYPMDQEQHDLLRIVLNLRDFSIDKYIEEVMVNFRNHASRDFDLANSSFGDGIVPSFLNKFHNIS